MPRYSRAQRKYFSRRAAELGLRFVDLTRPLQKAADAARDRELLYFPTNLHLTAAGHRAIGQALADVIDEHAFATTPAQLPDRAADRRPTATPTAESRARTPTVALSAGPR